ncbi:hypothetical protein H1C71_028851 [Ictidomys tridecemlineatus]|nr:hypothetical protein H1C71_028851 [Ictidomys tridecemlineatus]
MPFPPSEASLHPSRPPPGPWCPHVAPAFVVTSILGTDQALSMCRQGSCPPCPPELPWASGPPLIQVPEVQVSQASTGPRGRSCCLLCPVTGVPEGRGCCVCHLLPTGDVISLFSNPSCIPQEVTVSS